MNVSIYLQTAYENISDWTLGESKPNSNPIKPNFHQEMPKGNQGVGATDLFQLYQGDPVFVGVFGRMANGGRAGAGYLGYGAHPK